MITFNSTVLTQNVLSGPGIRKIFHSVVSETECCANSSPKGMKIMLQRLFSSLCVRKIRTAISVLVNTSQNIQMAGYVLHENSTCATEI